MKTLKKRRLRNKTDYKKRMGLLKGGVPRLVVRKTNKYILGQYVESKEAKDKVILVVTTKDLLKFGWPEKKRGSLKSIPVSYLAGFLIGKKILKEKLETPIFDLGMARSVHGSRLYSFINGFIDSGIKISHDKKIFPSKERIEGKHLKDIPFQEIKTKIEGK